MILQNLTLTQAAEKKGLYVRSENPCDEFPLKLSTRETVSFATYFNFFSLSKWRKYTSIDELRVVLKCKGVFRVAVDHRILVDGYEIVKTLLSLESDGDVDVVLPSLPDDGLLSISVTSLADGSVLFGGGFCSCSGAPNDVRIGIDVCTYRRESAVEEKVRSLDSFLCSCENDFANCVEMFVVDNGRTLPDGFGSDTRSLKVHVIPNENLGGSGGFTRGMMEIVNSEGFTHIILNDDDAQFDPESIYRTWSFLSFIKDEYKDAHIGGAMLTSERPNIVYGSGAVYSEREEILLHSLKQDLDVSASVDCLRFDAEEEINYFIWCYLTIPVSYVGELGYPLPLFIKWDDIEYSIRGGSTMITLNGVSIWHDSFRSKFLTYIHYNYYFARNYLVMGCTTGDLKRRDIIWALRNAMFEVISYRYESADIMFKGIEDFFRGPGFVFDLNPGGVVGQIYVKTERLDYLEKNADFTDADTIRRRDFRIRMLSLNGLLLPSEKNIKTNADNVDSARFYRAGKILYDSGGGEGFIAERNTGKTLCAIYRNVCLLIKTAFSFGRLKKEYKKSVKKYSSEENWRKIFKL